MWAAPALLAVLVIVIGVAPFLAEGIVTAAANAVTGADLHPHLKIWHGVTPALWMSIIAVAGGAILLTQHGWMDRVWNAACRGRRRRRSSTGWSTQSSPGARDHRGQPQRCDQSLSRHLHGHLAGAWICRLFLQRSVRADAELLPVAPSSPWAGSC
jgi:hypothetical protein